VKKVLIIGVVLFIVCFFGGFLAGATNGPDNQPIIPAIYGSNQALWMIFGVIGLIMTLVGLIGVIIKAIKK
jgi:hypothetical protein